MNKEARREEVKETHPPCNLYLNAVGESPVFELLCSWSVDEHGCGVPARCMCAWLDHVAGASVYCLGLCFGFSAQVLHAQKLCLASLHLVAHILHGA